MHEKEYAATNQSADSVVPDLDFWEAAYLRFGNT